MKFTYRNNLWKGEATNSIVPTNSRPFSNNDPNLTNISRTPMKANPIKHWRKQLQPYYSTPSSKQVSIDHVDNAVYIGSREPDCASSNKQLLKENITLLNDCVGTKKLDTSIRCVGGSFTVRRSASTNINKNYYTSYSKYLQAKCKTYEHKQILGTQNDDGTYQSTNCMNETINNCNKSIVYKPSNSNHYHQGAVSASANLLRKRNNVLTNNSASLKNAYGTSYVKAYPHYTDSNSSAYVLRYVKGSTDSTMQCNQLFKTCSNSG
jgi:hypothetical protein|tara:strand:+ start:1950 stop:2744 length:795 start_codon:yes stop_codon:yes gene_type:complete